MNQELKEDLLNKIFDQIYIIPTANESEVVGNIITVEADSNIAANMICEFLDIEKRANRRTIINLLEEYNANL